MTNFSHTEQHQIWIYVLKDPRDGAVRYVGKTRQTIEDRLKQHLKCARGSYRSHRDSWIRQLMKLDLQPEIEWIERGWLTSAQGSERERLWIKRLRERGCNLTNHTDGGDGGHGQEHSEATRAKIGAAVKANWAVRRAERSASMKDAWTDNDTRRTRASVAMKEMWRDEASPARLVRKTDEHRQKMSDRARIQSARRIRCDECGYTSDPRNLGKHQNFHKHSGRTELGGGE